MLRSRVSALLERKHAATRGGKQCQRNVELLAGLLMRLTEVGSVRSTSPPTRLDSTTTTTHRILRWVTEGRQRGEEEVAEVDSSELAEYSRRRTTETHPVEFIHAGER